LVASFQMIDMSGWINAGGLQFKEGSIEVFHLGEDLVLGAQVYLQDQNQSLGFDEKLVETKTFKSTRLDGLWWLPSQKGQVLLALSNNSDSPVTASIDSKGRTPQRDGQEVVALAAHETRLLDVQASNRKRYCVYLEREWQRQSSVSSADVGYLWLAQFNRWISVANRWQFVHDGLREKLCR